MPSRSLVLLVFAFLLSLSCRAWCDNLLDNADFANGTQGWHGDGHVVYLKPDGTEGDQTDSGAVPVLKIVLAKGQPHAVYQTLRSKDAASGTLHITVDVFASPDFKRSTHADDYATQDSFPMTVTDFLIRMQPDWWEQDSSLTVGNWKTVRADYGALQAVDGRTIYFQIPPGDGFVYLKNPVVTP
jgi:hypothetical protein